MNLQQLIERLIAIRDVDHISPSAPVRLVEDALPGNVKYKGINIQISESEAYELEPECFKYVVFGDDGYREHGGRPTEDDHEVIIYWEPVP